MKFVVQKVHNLYNAPDMDIKTQVEKLLGEFISGPAVSDMYAALLLYGPQTISQLARSSGVERTRIYRSLSELQTLQLVEVELQPHRQIIHPAPITNLQNKVAARKSALDDVSSDIGAFQALLDSRDQLAGAATKVQFYSGAEGIEQMLWNQTKTKGEILSILSENIQSHAGRAFFERWVERMNERGVVSRSLVDDSFIRLQKKWYGGTFSHALGNWTARKLPLKDSTIPHRTTVYDDVTTYFSWQDGDPFGIEIHNKVIADNQRQYFELLWGRAKPLVTD
jgi:DNA-binding transcriptional regulator GbsR (MarR family)